MDTTITKEQWQGIANTLKSGLYRWVEFRLDGHEIRVYLARIAECELAYCVYINGEMPRAWAADSDGFLPIYRKVLRRVVTKPYAKGIAKMKKDRGGRAFLKAKENAWVHETRESWRPWFVSVKSLVCQFSKIKGLELVTPLSEVMEVKDAC